MGVCVGTGSIGLNSHEGKSPRLRSCLEAVAVRGLMDPLGTILRSHSLSHSFETIEMPHLACLAKMECTGFGFDVEEFRKQAGYVRETITAIQQECTKYGRRRFDLSSPKDVGQVLFVDLKLPYEAKRVTGRRAPWSTDHAQLEKIKHLHPLPGMIIAWRKLRITLKNLIEPLDDTKTWCEERQMYRIHCLCSIHTATGRITMYDPNLQTMTKDFSLVLEGIPGLSSGHVISLRNMFYAPDGYILLSADYSQLELRIISHLAQDPTLIQLLNGGGDVFKDIASHWKAVPPTEVTDELRQQAKQMCYGIIYGMGSKALSEKLCVDEQTAEQLMTQFQVTFPGLKKYTASVVESCQNLGYVTTVAGRRRYLPNINSHNGRSRSQAERQAVNTTVQGSAADVIKLATISINDQLNPDVRLVLQIHDELIYEVPTVLLDKARNVITQAMESVTDQLELSVRLTVRVKLGPTWAKLH